METLKEVLKICQLGDCSGCEMHDYAHCRDLVMRDSLNVIEALEAELSRYTENCKRMVEQAKTEVAREIFADIEATRKKCFDECFKWYGNTDERREMLNYDAKLQVALDKLKKKYTEIVQ